MKVEFFVDSYRPYISGVITAVDMLSSQLRARGHEVTINAPAYPDYPKSDGEPGIRRIPSLPLPGYEGLRIATPLPFNLAPKGSLDLVHAHSPFPMGLAGLGLARERQVPLVYTCHSLYPDYSEYVPWASSTLRRVLEAHLQYFCNRCDAIIAPSEYVRRNLIEWGVNKPLYVSPTGIRLDHFSQVDPSEARQWILRRHNIPRDRFLLLFVGRLAQEKNLEHLLHEIVLAKNLGRDMGEGSPHLLLVGTGPHEETLRELVRKEGMQSFVTFAGTVDHAKVVNLYRGADSFVFTAINETQGIVLLEALAASLPVVALSAPATREIVRDGVEGLIVARKKGSLARALHRLRTSADLKDLLSDAAARRAKDFAIEQTLDDLEDIYTEVKEDYVPPKRLTLR